MPPSKITKVKSAVIWSWLKGHPELSILNGNVFCKACGKMISSDRKFLVNQHLGTDLHKRKLRSLEEWGLSQTTLPQVLVTTKKQNELQPTPQPHEDETQVASNIKIEENDNRPTDDYRQTDDNRQTGDNIHPEIDFFVKGVAAKLMKLQNENFRMIVQRDIDMLLYDAIIGIGRYSSMNKEKEESNCTQNFGGDSNFNTEPNQYLETIIKTEDPKLL